MRWPARSPHWSMASGANPPRNCRCPIDLGHAAAHVRELVIRTPQDACHRERTHWATGVTAASTPTRPPRTRAPNLADTALATSAERHLRDRQATDAPGEHTAVVSYAQASSYLTHVLRLEEVLAIASVAERHIGAIGRASVPRRVLCAGPAGVWTPTATRPATTAGQSDVFVVVGAVGSATVSAAVSSAVTSSSCSPRPSLALAVS